MIFISGKASDFTNSVSEKTGSLCVKLILYNTFPHILLNCAKYSGFDFTLTSKNYVGVNLKVLFCFV